MSWNAEPIVNRWQYQEARKRLETADQLIEQNGGFMQAPKDWVDLRQRIATQMFNYELEKGMIACL